MATPTYSAKLFAQGPLASASEAFGPVPDGKLWVIRDVVFQNIAVPPAISSAVFIVADFDTLVAGVPQASVIAGSLYHWRGRQVLAPGETSHIDSPDFSNWFVSVMGYVLTLP